MNINKRYKCTECGSENVFYSLLVDQKENKTYFDPKFDVGYCYDCNNADVDNEVILEEIK